MSESIRITLDLISVPGWLANYVVGQLKYIVDDKLRDVNAVLVVTPLEVSDEQQDKDS